MNIEQTYTPVYDWDTETETMIDHMSLNTLVILMERDLINNDYTPFEGLEND